MEDHGAEEAGRGRERPGGAAAPVARVRVYTGPAGSEDELDLLLELNDAVGSTSGATDRAPEIEWTFSFR